jgi:hypothetical protein
MSKTKRSAYTALNDGLVVADHKLKRVFKIRFLVNTDALLLTMGPLAIASKYCHNKQTYGPIKVEVRVEGDPPKEKRIRKRKGGRTTGGLTATG